VPQVFRLRFFASFFSGKLFSNEKPLFELSNFEDRFRQPPCFFNLKNLPQKKFKNRQQVCNLLKCICFFDVLDQRDCVSAPRTVLDNALETLRTSQFDCFPLYDNGVNIWEGAQKSAKCPTPHISSFFHYRV